MNSDVYSGDTATASCRNTPSALWSIGLVAPRGSHSHTRPRSYSSHDNHVPQGVAPPAQLPVVWSRMRAAPVIWPVASKRIALAPPRPTGSRTSLLLTRYHPPAPSAMV